MLRWYYPGLYSLTMTSFRLASGSDWRIRSGLFERDWLWVVGQIYNVQYAK